jgi:REP element-mobilizing transposase RayT
MIGYGALYHITSRGNRQENVYESDADREAFLSILSHVCDRYNWVCYAYCLMDNHYHLLIETPDANLSKGMRQLNGVYTQTFNRIHGRVGHIFQGRYKAILVDKDSYLLELSRYIVLNPVRAGMVHSPAEWPWSSYSAMLGQADSTKGLSTERLLALFGNSREKAVMSYKKFVSEGLEQPSPWQFLRNQIFLGNDEFVEEAQSLINGKGELSEIPASQRRLPPMMLDDYEASSPDRNSAIVNAYQSGGYTLKEIGRHFGLHYSTVSGIVRNHKLKT